MISTSIYANEILIFFRGWMNLKACSGMKGSHNHIVNDFFLYFFSFCTFEGWKKVFSDRPADCFQNWLPLDSLLWNYRWGRRWVGLTVLVSWFFATFTSINSCGPLGACHLVRTMDMQREGHKRNFYGKSKLEFDFLRTCLY